MNASQPIIPLSTEMQDAIRSLNPYLLRSTIFSIVASLLILAPSVYMLEVYARVVDSRSHSTLAMLTIMVIGAYAVMEILELSRSQILRYAALEFDKMLSPRIFRAIFLASIRRGPGGSPQPLNDLRVVRDFFSSQFLIALAEVPIAIIFLFLIFLINPILGWFALIGAIIQTIIGWLNDRSTQPVLLEANRSAIAAQQYADNSLQNAQVVQAMGMLNNLHKRWYQKQSTFLTQQAEASSYAGAYQAIGKGWQQIISSGLLGLACWVMIKGQLTGGGGMMIVASILGGRVLSPVLQIVAQWQQFINSKAAWGRLIQLLTHYPLDRNQMSLPSPQGHLQVEQLMAGAPTAQAPILKGINFSLNPGEVLAVVGPSGSGKTTLARLLIGVWPSITGKVRLDGADIHQWDKTELGQHLGYLPQDVELLDGSIAENIARFGAIDQLLLEEVTKELDLHDFIVALPHGYQTKLGRTGVQLSGGQRQRIALARALYRKPAFVVLDEPNSSLDDAGNKALINAISHYKNNNVTFVIITHRINVLSISDKMLVLRDGFMQAFGDRDEVLTEMNKSSTHLTSKAKTDKNSTLFSLRT